MSKIVIEDLTQILEILQDSKEHNIEEIKNEILLPNEIMDIMLKFLKEQSFIENLNGTIRITNKGLKFLKLPSL